MARTCDVCGTNIEHLHPLRRVCSDECKVEKVRIISRSNYIRRHGGSPPMEKRRCSCGRMFEAEECTQIWFCSRACRQTQQEQLAALLLRQWDFVMEVLR